MTGVIRFVLLAASNCTTAVTHHLRFHPSVIRKANLACYVAVTRLGLVMTTEVAKQFLMYLTSFVLRSACNVLELTEYIKLILYC